MFRRLTSLLAIIIFATPVCARVIPFPLSTTQRGFNSLGSSASAIFTDNFQRANQTLETSSSWSVLTGSAGAAAIASNALTYAGSGKTNPTIYGAPDPGSNDQFAEITVGTVTASINALIVAVRCNATQYVGVRISSASQVQILDYNNGTFTTDVSGSTVPNSGDVLRIAVSGNTVAYFINGVQQGTAGTTSITSGVPGFAIRAVNQSNVATAWRSGAGSGS